MWLTQTGDSRTAEDEQQMWYYIFGLNFEYVVAVAAVVVVSSFARFHHQYCVSYNFIERGIIIINVGGTYVWAHSYIITIYRFMCARWTEPVTIGARESHFLRRLFVYVVWLTRVRWLAAVQGVINDTKKQ